VARGEPVVIAILEADIVVDEAWANNDHIGLNRA
jgi:hypothetical protein